MDDYAHALQLDIHNGNNKWKEAINLEIEQFKEYQVFKDFGKAVYEKNKITNAPEGHQKMRVHLVFDVNHCGKFKARLVADGHLTKEPMETVYSGVVSIRSLRLTMFLPELCQSERVSVPRSNYIPQMGGKTYVMNIQTKTNQDKENGLVYNHDEARVLVTVITTFNKHMECIVEEHGQQYAVTYSLKAGINKFGDQAKASAHKEMKHLHDRSCLRPVHKHSLNKFEKQRAIQSLLFLTEKGDKMIKS